MSAKSTKPRAKKTPIKTKATTGARKSAPKVMQKRTCLLVLGMHRSGTSALTRVLNLLGAALPRSVLGAGDGNEEGHWEPQRLVSYNDRLLEELQSSWHDWRPLELTQLPLSRRDQIKADFRELIEADYGRSDFFVVKDPRICRFANLFIEALEEEGIRVVPILLVRNPLEVIASLKMRANLWPSANSDADAVLLWLSHVLMSEKASRDRKRAFVSYEALMADWREVVAGIAKQTGIRWPTGSEDAAPLIDSFLSDKLHRQKRKVSEVALDPITRGWTSTVFEAVTVLTGRTASRRPFAVLDDISSELRHSAPLLSDMISAAKARANVAIAEKAKLENDLTGIRGELVHSEEAASVAHTERAKLEGELTRVRRELAHSEKEAEAYRSQVDAALTKQSSLERTISRLRGNLTRGEREENRLRDEGIQLRHTVANLKLELTQQTQVLSKLRDTLSVRDGDNRELNDIVAELVRDIEDATSKTDSLAGQVSALEAETQDNRDQISNIIASNQVLENEIEEKNLQLNIYEKEIENTITEFVSSTSWKVTSPIRSAKRVLRNARNKFVSFSAATYRALPLQRGSKQWMKSAVFTTLPFVFRSSSHYIVWKENAEFKSRYSGEIEQEPQISSTRARWSLENAKKESTIATSSLPPVTIIIPCYDDAQFLWGSVSSAYSSYSGPKEIIVVNDGSKKQSTENIIRNISQLYTEIRIVNKENGGLASARNKGVEAASGKYIQFLDADDLLAPGKIDRQVQELEEFDGCSAVVSQTICSNEDISVFNAYECEIQPGMLEFSNFLFSWERSLSIPIHAALFRKSAIPAPPFDVSLKAKEDWLFWCETTSSGSLRLTDFYSAIYRIHGSNMTANFEAMGAAWNETSKILAKKFGAQFPKFEESAKQWFDAYYVPRSNNVSAPKRADGQSSTNTSAEPAEVFFDHELWACNWGRRFARDEDARISVIVPVYNHYKYLRQCLDSLDRQSGVAFEVVIVDDKSSDERVRNLVDCIARYDRAVVIRNDTNKGISESQNIAARVASGDYLAFLDCDDFLEDNALEEVECFICSNDPAVYYFSDRRNVRADGSPENFAVYGAVQSGRGIKADLADRMIASHLKVISKAAYLDVGGCRDWTSGVQDWDLALRVSEQGPIRYIEKALYNHRVHSESNTFTEFVGNKKKASVVRRQHLERNTDRKLKLGKIRKILIEELRANRSERLSSDLFQVMKISDISLDTWFCPAEISRAWSENKAVVFDARGTFDAKITEFVVDFNSSFDFVIVDQVDVAGSMVGALWNSEMLISPLTLR